MRIAAISDHAKNERDLTDAEKKEFRRTIETLQAQA